MGDRDTLSCCPRGSAPCDFSRREFLAACVVSICGGDRHLQRNSLCPRRNEHALARGDHSNWRVGPAWRLACPRDPETCLTRRTPASSILQVYRQKKDGMGSSSANNYCEYRAKTTHPEIVSDQDTMVLFSESLITRPSGSRKLVYGPTVVMMIPRRRSSPRTASRFFIERYR